LPSTILQSRLHSYEFRNVSITHKEIKIYQTDLCEQKGCINVKIFLMTTVYLLRAPKYLVGSSMKETKLKRKSMIARKSESLKERLILWKMFNPQITIPIPRDEYGLIFSLFSGYHMNVHLLRPQYIIILRKMCCLIKQKWNFLSWVSKKKKNLMNRIF